MYGPLYVSSELSSDNTLFTHPSLSFTLPNNINTPPELKSILKKRGEITVQQNESRYWPKCTSDSGKQSVRFGASIIKIQYIPEVPITHCHNKIVTANIKDQQQYLPQSVLIVIHYFKSIFYFQIVSNEPLKLVIHFFVSAIPFVTWILYQTFLITKVVYKLLVNTLL